MKVVVAGSVAQRAAYAGHVWAFLQYLLGLQDLGHEVMFVDVLSPSGDPANDRWRAGHLTRQLQALGEQVPVCVLGVEHLGGVTPDQALAFARSAAVLINVMGFLKDERLLDAVPLRVFLDIDPGFGQMWKALGQADVLSGHDVHVTVGTNVGRPDCTVPACGLDWVSTLPPVVLRHWPARPVTTGPFTTVASWRGPFAPVDYLGTTYGLRVHEFRRFLDLPATTDATFELAMDIDDADAADVDRLRRGGWRLRPPGSVASSVTDYRGYLQGSRGEFMVAKNMYVATRSGWLSDRSVCYLASGRPVLAQDTGLGDLPLDDGGLVLFHDEQTARDAVRRVLAEPDRHAAAARALAESTFASHVVLPALLDGVGLT